MIAVLIPAHNEEALIARCLTSVCEAAGHPGLRGEPVSVVVTLDRCRDDTARIVAGFNLGAISVEHGNVGRARHAAATHALALGARWLASTDADSVVPADWLVTQISAGAGAFCGMVRVEDWENYSDHLSSRFEALHPASDGHPHIHGANMGVASEWYVRCGGFPPLAAHEDVALIDRLQAAGAPIARLGAPLVITSARRVARAPAGFSQYLEQLDVQLHDAHQGDSGYASVASKSCASRWAASTVV